MIYDLFEKKNIFNKKYDKTTEFLSHCKLFNSWLVYVEENKHVRLLNYITNELKTIYSHKQPIMALDIFVSGDWQSISQNENDRIILQIDDILEKKPHRNENKEKNPLVNNDNLQLNQLSIFSIDYSGTLMVYKNGLLLHNFNVLRFILSKIIFKKNKFYLKVCQISLRISKNRSFYSIWVTLIILNRMGFP